LLLAAAAAYSAFLFSACATCACAAADMVLCTLSLLLLKNVGNLQKLLTSLN
jgi:hypothetical protein